MEKIKKHYNENQLYYYIFALTIGLIGINGIIKILDKFTNLLSFLIYNNFYESKGILLIILSIYIIPVFFISIISLRKGFLGLMKLYFLINFLIILIFVFIFLLQISKFDKRQEIYDKIEILNPYISIDEKKEINKKIYNVKNKNNYLELKLLIDKLIDEKIN